MKQAFTPLAAPSVSATGRTWSLRLLLLTVIACIAAKAQAQYELTLYGKNLTHSTYTTSTDNATCSALKSGTIKFNAQTGEVTLTNVVFENTQTGLDGNFMSLSRNSSSGGHAYIYLKGTNKIISGGQKPIRLSNVDVTFMRVLESGCDETNCILDIHCNSTAAYGISLNNCSAFVSNCTVKVHGGAYSFFGEHTNSYEKLSTTCAIIYAQGGTASVGHIYDLELGYGNTIRRPAGAAFSSSLRGIALNGKLVTDEVLICDNTYVEPGDTEKPTVGTLSSNDITDSSVRLKWTQATDNETSQANLKYRLRYKKNADTSWSTAFNYTKNITTYTVSNLDYDTKYDFLLSVMDEAGNEANYTQQSYTTNPIDYGIDVAEVRVTSRNASDITSNMIKAGTVSYDPDTRTLKLNKATIEGAGHTLFTFNTHPGLNIQLEGSNSITNASSDCIALWGESRIYGSGSLTLQAKAEERGGIKIYADCKLTIENTTIITRGTYGLQGDPNLNSHLVIKNSTVKAYGTKGSIKGFNSLTLEDSYFSEPTGAHFSPEAEAVVDTHNSIVQGKDVVIERAKVYIAGQSLLPGATISNLGGGSASLDSKGNTLTLNNVTISTGEDNPGIKLTTDEDFTIKLKGNNTINTTSSIGLATTEGISNTMHNLTIEGPGSLKIWMPDGSCAISTSYTNVVFKNCTVTLNAETGVESPNLVLIVLLTAIFGGQYDIGTGVLETLTIDNSNVYFVHDAGVFVVVDGFYLNKCNIVSPSNAVYNQGVMTVDGENYNGPITIERQGTATDIDGITDMQSDAPWTSLGGQRISKPTKAGIYLHGGKKVVVK